MKTSLADRVTKISELLKSHEIQHTTNPVLGELYVREWRIRILNGTKVGKKINCTVPRKQKFEEVLRTNPEKVIFVGLTTGCAEVTIFSARHVQAVKSSHGHVEDLEYESTLLKQLGYAMDTIMEEPGEEEKYDDSPPLQPATPRPRQRVTGSETTESVYRELTALIRKAKNLRLDPYLLSGFDHLEYMFQTYRG